MSWNMVSVNKRVHVRRPTDGTQNYKNVAQAQAALSNAQVAQEKLKLAQLASTDKHELDKVKFARESIKLEQEAKEYWNNLSEEDRQRIAGQLFIENQAQLIAYQNNVEDKKKYSEINHKWQQVKVNSANFSQKAWEAICVIIGVCIILPLAIAMLVAFFRALFHL